MTSALASKKKQAPRSPETGLTLIEILISLSLVAILSVSGITLLTGSVDENRYDATVQEIKQVRAALIGDTTAIQGGTRSSFGYLGDMGALPPVTAGTPLDALLAKPATAPLFTVNTTARFGLGWNGPYLQAGAGGKSPLVDAWGRNYQYAINAAGVATISSLGADGATGGTGYAQDIAVTVPAELQRAVIYGFVSDGGSAFTSAAQVEISYPDGNGALQQALQSTAAQGSFQFNNIPLGPRSLTVYSPSKAAPAKTIGPIAFTVDKARFLVPVNLTDVNPGNVGAGGSSAGCTTSSNFASVPATFGVSSGSQIIFYLQFTQNVSVKSARVSVANAAALSSLLADGLLVSCGTSPSYAPCPAINAQDFIFSAPIDLTASGTHTITLNFNRTVANITNMSVDLNYASGCDRVSVTGLL